MLIANAVALIRKGDFAVARTDKNTGKKTDSEKRMGYKVQSKVNIRKRHVQFQYC